MKPPLITSRRGLALATMNLPLSALKHPEVAYESLTSTDYFFLSDATDSISGLSQHTLSREFYDDPNRFVAELRAYRLATGQTAKAMGLRFGVIEHYWLDLEQGVLKNYDTELIHTICRTLGIRFNYLGSGGPVRSSALEILNDLFARTVTVGIKLSELESYLGVSYQTLYKNILADNLTPEHWKILTTKMRMRIKPPKQDKDSDAIGTKGIISELYRLQSLWDCSLSELANMIGIHPDALVEMLHSEPSTSAHSVIRCALFLGYRGAHTPATLPRVFGQYPNSDLVASIEQQLSRLKWTITQLIQETGISRADFYLLIKNLRSTEDHSAETFPSCDTLNKICHILNIELFTLETQPETFFTVQNGWPTDAPLLWTSIETSRKKLKISRQRIISELGISSTTIRKMIAGDFSGKKRNTLIAYARKLKIRFDSFAGLIPVKFSAMPSSEELTTLLNERFASSLLDRDTLADYADTTPDRITFIMQGRVSLTNPLLARVARILRVHLSVTNDQSKADWLWQIDQSLGLTNRAQKFAELGLDELTYAKLMRGDFSFSERAVQYLGFALNVITPEFAHSVFNDLENKLAWSAELRTRLITDGNSVETICDELGIEANRWNDIISGHFAWNDEDITLLAERFKIYNRTLIQIMLEDNGGEHVNGFAKETGISSKLLGHGNFYRAYNVRGLETTHVPMHRRQILDQIVLNPTRSMINGESDFLKCSGGLPEQIPHSPIDHTHYLFSIGDVSSAAIYARHHGMESETYLSHYDHWLHNTYGLSAAKFQAREKIRLTGKRLDVHRNAFGLALALPSHRPNSLAKH